MKAILLKQYGTPDELEVGEVSKPEPKEDEVLVKIYSASVNDWDWGIVRGKPYIIRLFFGFKKPKVKIPGIDISGKIEAIGAKVIDFAIGDEVYADLSDSVFGGFAEYVCVPERVLSKKPSQISHNQACAIPHAGVLALQSLFDKAHVKDGQSILINGAGGGVGTLGVQILKSYDIKLTGVDHAEKLDLLLSLGYDKVIDYNKTDFTATGEQYDVIFDAKTNRSVFKYKRALKKNGTYVTVGGSMSRLLEIAILGGLFSRFSSKKMMVLSLKPNKDLDQLTKLANENQLNPVIDGPYEFDEIPELIQYFGEAKHKGKIVVEIVKP